MTEQEIREILIKIDKGYMPTYVESHELAYVKSISLFFDKKIPKSIKRLERLINLDLSHSKGLTDISALSSMTTLKSINLTGNSALTDISALSDLKKLEALFLGGTNVRDFSSLSTLTMLRILSLSENNFVRNLYTYFWLDNDTTGVSEKYNNFTLFKNIFGTILISEIAKETLYKTTQYSINDINKFFISKFYFEIADKLSKGRVIDIGSLSHLRSLEVLDLSGVHVSDIDALSELKELKALLLNDTQVKDINALSELKKLLILGLRGTEVEDIHALSGLTDLKYLDLGSTNVNDISSISGLASLKGLNLSSLTLSTLPEFLLDLDLEFTKDVPYYFNGICISDVSEK